MKYEKRKALRRNLRHRALVIRLDNSVVDDCTVSDISATGAQIKLDAKDDFPDEFNLILTRGAKVHRRCAVVWRTKNRIGVRFVAPEKEEIA